MSSSRSRPSAQPLGEGGLGPSPAGKQETGNAGLNISRNDLICLAATRCGPSTEGKVLVGLSRQAACCGVWLSRRLGRIVPRCNLKRVFPLRLGLLSP